MAPLQVLMTILMSVVRALYISTCKSDLLSSCAAYFHSIVDFASDTMCVIGRITKHYW